MTIENDEYIPFEEEYGIKPERTKRIIEELKEKIQKGNIEDSEILNIGENDEEYSFIYDWLYDREIVIIGRKRYTK